jgi:hypothetical protein
MEGLTGVIEGGARVEALLELELELELNRIVARDVGKCLIEALRATTTPVARAERISAMSSWISRATAAKVGQLLHRCETACRRGPCRPCLAMSRIEHRDRS